MHIAIAHVIGAPLREVEEVVLDATRVAQMPEGLSTLASAELLRHEERAGGPVRVARFRLLDTAIPAAWRGRVRTLGWTEEVHWDRASHTGSFVIEPTLPRPLQRRVTCRGTYRLEDMGDRTLRVISATLAVRIPLIAGTVEARLLDLLEGHFDAEAQWLERALTAREPDYVEAPAA